MLNSFKQLSLHLFLISKIAKLAVVAHIYTPVRLRQDSEC